MQVEFQSGAAGCVAIEVQPDPKSGGLALPRGPDLGRGICFDLVRPSGGGATCQPPRVYNINGLRHSRPTWLGGLAGAQTDSEVCPSRLDFVRLPLRSSVGEASVDSCGVLLCGSRFPCAVSSITCPCIAVLAEEMQPGPPGV